MFTVKVTINETLEKLCVCLWCSWSVLMRLLSSSVLPVERFWQVSALEFKYKMTIMLSRICA